MQKIDANIIYKVTFAFLDFAIMALERTDPLLIPIAIPNDEIK
jgi:hypothetical protein